MMTQEARMNLLPDSKNTRSELLYDLSRHTVRAFIKEARERVLCAEREQQKALAQ